jgi:hypothetical protein
MNCEFNQDWIFTIKADARKWEKKVGFKPLSSRGRYYPRYFGIHEKVVTNLGEMRRRNADVIQVVHGRF